MCGLAVWLGLNFYPSCLCPCADTTDIPFAAGSPWASVTGILQDLLGESWRPDEAAGLELNTQWLGFFQDEAAFLWDMSPQSESRAVYSGCWQVPMVGTDLSSVRSHLPAFGGCVPGS